MGTIVAVETDGGVAIAGDSRTTRDGTVASEAAGSVFDFGEVGAGAVGDQGDVDELRRRLDVELDETERDREVTIEVLATIAADVAEDTGVEAVVACRDDDGTARAKQVDPDGGILPGPVFALGSGAQVALGMLESADRDRELGSTEAFVRDVMESVAERDADTGSNVDLWSLASE